MWGISRRCPTATYVWCICVLNCPRVFLNFLALLKAAHCFYVKFHKMLLLTLLCLVFCIFITIILVYIYYKLRVFMTWQVNQFFQLYLVRSDCRRDQPSLFWFAILHIFWPVRQNMNFYLSSWRLMNYN